MNAPVPDPQRAATVALLGLPGMGPFRHQALLAHAGDAVAAWEAVRCGVPTSVDLRCVQKRSQLVEGWRTVARRIDPQQVLDQHRAAGVEVLLPADPGWPPALAHDPEPPAALFVQGDLGLLGEVGVAVVGTRRCTAAGAQVARRLGAGLTDAGLTVISGLALGIDGAAHRGVLDAGGAPLAVVGSGLDHVYPHRNHDLWTRVAGEGALVSESPLGRPPERWRFPARNRIIAGLSRAVVVVESRDRGGSMLTAEEALERDIPVLAVPGPVLTEHSAGTNRLITEGATLVRDVTDVLTAVGAGSPGGRAACSTGEGAGGDAPADPATQAVAAVLSPAPVSAERVADAAGIAMVDAVTALARLEAAGRVRRVPGGYEAVVP